MSAIFEQIFVLLVFVAVGAVLSGCKIVRLEHSKILSSLLVYLFLPCNIFKTFSTNFTVKYITERYSLLLISLVLLLCIILISHLISKLFAKDIYSRYIYEYSLISPNYGYMGYPLVENLLGSAGLVDFMVFALPVSLYIYTIGFAKLTKRPINCKKLLNPAVIATGLGILFGLTGLTLPSVFNKICTTASSCVGPISMLLTGMVIAQFNVKVILHNARVYILTLIRLIALPLSAGLILSCFFDTSIVQIVVMFLALPCGMNTVVFPRLVDEDCHIGAGLALVSTVLSCVTIPLIISFFHI